MNLVIKQTSPSGRDTKIFRAYYANEVLGGRDLPVGVSASTTGNAEYGAVCCARKAVAKLALGDAKRAGELQGKVSVREMVPGVGVWLVIFIGGYYLGDNAFAHAAKE